MKNFIKVTGIITLFCFSFFYTDKVMNVVSDKDPLKVEIENKQSLYNIEPKEASISSDTIIPGLNGKTVNIMSSYKNMRPTNTFNSNMLIYDPVYPQNRLINNLDKYILGGNPSNKNISLIFIINNNYYLNKILKILDNKKIIANIYIDYKYLNNNINIIRNIYNHSIYLYQEEYSYDSLVISNNIIKRITNKEPKYCLSIKKNKNNLSVCSYNKMNTILPSIYTNINDIKNNLDNGMILSFNNYITIEELDYIISFIISKGYNIVSLDELLNENLRINS